MTDPVPWMDRWAALQQANESTQSIAASTLVCELAAENERLKRQVGELSVHAEKWVKRALGSAPEPCARHGQIVETDCPDCERALGRAAQPPSPQPTGLALELVRTDLTAEQYAAAVEAVRAGPPPAVEHPNSANIVGIIRPPGDVPALSFGQAVTDGQIVAIYAGEEGAEFKLLRHNIHGVRSEVRRPWNMRSTFRPATYDEMRSACPHDWLMVKWCDVCNPRTPGDGQT